MSCANASSILRSASTCARRAACASRPASGSAFCAARKLTVPRRSNLRTSPTSCATSSPKSSAITRSGSSQMRRQRKQRRRQHRRRIDVERAHDRRRTRRVIRQHFARRQPHLARMFAHERHRFVERRNGVRRARNSFGIHGATAHRARRFNGISTTRAPLSCAVQRPRTISTRHFGLASFASTVARGGVSPCATHSSHTAFMPAKCTMSEM